MQQPSETPPSSKLSVCILYGLAEGEATGSELRKTLAAHDWNVTQDVQGADVLLAHSGGCFLIPETSQTKLLVLIGIPYWPGRTLLSSTMHKTRLTWQASRHDRHTSRWLRDELRHLRYLCSMRQNYRMWLGRKRRTLWSLAPETVVIRNQEDSYMTPDLQSLPFQGQPAYTMLPGNHDDLWHNPEPYVAIIKAQYAARFLV